jgi:hypothetical protein
MPETESRRFEWRDFAILVSLAAAAAFVITVARIMGELLSSDNMAITKFMVLIDYVNLAVPFMPLFVIAVLIGIIFVATLFPDIFSELSHEWAKSEHSHATKRRSVIVRLIPWLVALIAPVVVVWLAAHFASGNPFVSDVAALLCLAAFLGLLAFFGLRHFHPRQVNFALMAIGLVAVACTEGYMVASGQRCQYTVVLAGGQTLHPIWIYSLERGLVLAWHGRFRVVSAPDTGNVRVEWNYGGQCDGRS